jgi:methyl coenzyme M reductase subunit C-like uncharacterized protein (methanogenesis marker protein 7)
MRQPVTKHGKELLLQLEKFEVDGELDRWSEGIEHHPMSEKLVRDLSEIDWMFFNDYFHFKIGGDGDNGESLMYMLDILFDLYDRE